LNMMAHYDRCTQKNSPAAIGSTQSSGPGKEKMEGRAARKAICKCLAQYRAQADCPPGWVGLLRVLLTRRHFRCYCQACAIVAAGREVIALHPAHTLSFPAAFKTNPGRSTSLRVMPPICVSFSRLWEHRRTGRQPRQNTRPLSLPRDSDMSYLCFSVSAASMSLSIQK
jgi:hypothetical protein